MSSKRMSRWYGWIVLLGVVILATAGCPSMMQPNGVTKLTTVFTSSQGAKTAQAYIMLSDSKSLAMADIESLTVTITKITLDRCQEETPPATDGETPAAKQSDSAGDPAQDCADQEVVFEGALDVNLKDLMGLSQVLSSADIPSGKYTKIRLTIENPRLVLASDPSTTYTNVKLTANGNLFVSKQFELPDGQDSLLVLDFGGIHLVENGNGNFVLTPQLRADISVTSADATAEGTVSNLDTENDQFTLTVPEGDVSVVYTNAVIYLPTDTDTPTGTEADLVDGLEVNVVGTLHVDGSIAATEIRILPPPAP